MKAYFERMARYNRWANRRFYGAVAQLEPEEFHAPRHGFFPSIAKTLNHILVADRIWLGRFTGQLSAHTQLNETIHDDFAQLKAAREAEDERIIAFFRALSQARLESVFEYKNLAGEPKSSEMLAVAAHFFNHQTHHRGQAHGLLTARGIDPGATDLPWVVPLWKD